MRTLALAAAALALACGSASGPGIEVLGVQLLASGTLARLDYRVVDATRARRALLGTPRLRRAGDAGALSPTELGPLGPARQRPSETGVVQFVLFTNAGGALRPGDRAVLELGETRVPDIPVS